MGVVAAVVAVIGAAITYVTQRKAAKKAEKAQKERAAITSAMDKNRQQASKRRALRERRVKIARIKQGAVNTGVSGSSGDIGSTSAINTNYSSNVAFAQGERLGFEGINRQNQKIASAQSDAQQGAALGSLFSSASSFIASNPFGGFGSATGGYSGGTTGTAPSGQTRGISPWGTFGGGV